MRSISIEEEYMPCIRDAHLRGGAVMDLFLVPNNPLQTSLLSPNGSVLYKVTTTKVHGRSVSRVTRGAGGVVAEIQWRNWDTTTTVRSPQLPGLGGIGTCASDFLYRRGRGVLSSSL